jgi:hypothetical protein
MYYLDRKLDKSDTILMWIIRNFHYYWLGGPKPSGIHKPRREYNTENKNEAFRKNLSCNACHQPFTYDDILTDPRLVVMTRYNEWMYSHIQTCTVVHVDISSVIRKAKAKLEFEAEQKERKELEDHRYEEWKLQQKEGLIRTPSIDLDQQEHDARVLRVIMYCKKMYNKRPPRTSEGNRKLHALSQYCALQYDRHHILTTEASRDAMQVLAKKHDILLVKYGKKFPKYGKYWQGNPTSINDTKFTTGYKPFNHPVRGKDGTK